MHLRSIDRGAQDLKLVDPYIGDLDLMRVHDGTLERFVQDRLKDGKAHGAINRRLRVVHNVLKHATSGATSTI